MGPPVPRPAVGGRDVADDLQELRQHGAQVIIGTPGRVKDVLDRMAAGLDLKTLGAWHSAVLPSRPSPRDPTHTRPFPPRPACAACRGPGARRGGPTAGHGFSARHRRHHAVPAQAAPHGALLRHADRGRAGPGAGGAQESRPCERGRAESLACGCGCPRHATHARAPDGWVRGLPGGRQAACLSGFPTQARLDAQVHRVRPVLCVGRVPGVGAARVPERGWRGVPLDPARQGDAL